MNRRLGISVPSAVHALAELPEVIRRAEALGFTDCWSFETNGFDAFTPLAAAAAVTGRMRLGTAIVPAYFRPAGLLAMHAAAMSDLAPGRFVLGVGSSTQVVVEQWMGIPFRRPRTVTRQLVLDVKALLAGGRVGGMRLASPPSAPVPVWMAALGERMLATAGEVADGITLFMTGPRIIPTLLAGTGRGLDSMCRITTFPGDDEAVRVAARRAITGYAIVPYYAGVLARQGFAEEVAAINARWSEGDRAGAARQVSDAMLRELVLFGSPDDILAGLQRYREAGLGCPVLAIVSPAGSAAERRRLHDHLLAELARAM